MKEKFVEWRPEWTPEEEQQVQEAVAYLKRRVSALKALREQLGVSQAELADILETTQSNVSKMEAKFDARVSVLRRVVEHKGGVLKIVAEFDGKQVELPV